MHLAELSTSRVPLCSSNGRSAAPGPSSELSEELAVGVEPAALDVRVAPSTRDRSCLTFVSHHQPPNVVGKTLMVPRLSEPRFGVSNFEASK